VEVADGCRFGDPKGKRVLVLIGDSHAAHWFPALEESARAQGWQLHYWAKAACGYADVPQYLLPFKRPYDECGAWRSALMRKIEALPRVDAVLVGRSSTYLGQIVDGDGNVADQQTAAGLWGQGATRTMTTLMAAATRVYLLRDSPRPGGDVPACLSANLTAPQNCAYPRRTGTVYPDEALLAAESEATRVKGVRILDLTPLVCSTDPCPVVSPAGAIMFRDWNHLTETFSRELAEPVGATLARALS
jgi:hypothetical protein